MVGLMLLSATTAFVSAVLFGVLLAQDKVLGVLFLFLGIFGLCLTRAFSERNGYGNFLEAKNLPKNQVLLVIDSAALPEGDSVFIIKDNNGTIKAYKFKAGSKLPAGRFSVAKDGKKEVIVLLRESE